MARAVNVDQAERLRDGYQYSFLLSSALIHCCDRHACASVFRPAHPFEINACYAATFISVEERDVGGREATLL